MLLKSIIAAMTFSLAGLFGCSKSTPVSSTSSTNGTIAAQLAIKDLGVLQLTNHYETCVAVDSHRDCRIVPKMVSRHEVQLTLTLESKSVDGKISGLSIVQMDGDIQKPFQFSIGNKSYTFTPQIAPE
jgi:hypothetical protein